MSHEHEHHELTRAINRLIGINIVMASALENLTTSIAGLTTAVDSAVTEILLPHATDAQVQAAADAVDSQSKRLTDAVSQAQGTTPPPAP